MPTRVPRRIELEGELVRLRPVAPADGAPAFALLHGEREVLRWLVWDGPETAAELEQRYGRWISAGPEGPDFQLAIEELATGELVGCLGQKWGEQPGTGVLGYWLGKPHWGRGLMGEAIRLSLHLGFRRLGGSSMVAQVFVGNETSRRVLERCGFVLTHTSPGGLVKGGVPVDAWCFAIARAEFEQGFGAFAPRRERVVFERARGSV